MPIDASIYQLAGRGVKSVADYDNEYSQARQNKLQETLGANKLQDYQRGVERQNRLQGVLGQSYAAPEARETALLQGGFLEEATKLGKDRRDNAQTEANTKAKALETAHKRLEVVGQGLGWLKDNASPENAQSLIQHWVQTGVMSQQDAQQKMVEFQRDPTPQGIQKLALMGYQGALSAKDQLPKIETRNLGGTTDTLKINPITGAVEVANSVQNTESPDGRASRQIQREQLAETRRHHGVTEGQKRQEIEGDRASGLPVLGVPAPTVTPWGNQSNPKDANKVKAQEMSRGSKEIEKDVDAARKEAATAAAAARFLELNKKIPTGGLTDKMSLTRWAQSMGAEYSEMEAITAKLAPAMREPGSGSTSDFDGKQFERATVGVDKPGKANENIAKGIIARAQQAQEYADFRQTYLEQNGTLSGADRYWKDYVNKNPIFDSSKPESYELNAKRKPWSEHFKAKTSGPAKPDAPSGGLSKEEQAEYEALKERFGR